MSKERLPYRAISEIFTENRAPLTDFEAAQQLLCFDISVDEREIFFLFEEAKTKAKANSETGGTFFC